MEVSRIMGNQRRVSHAPLRRTENIREIFAIDALKPENDPDKNRQLLAKALKYVKF